MVGKKYGLLVAGALIASVSLSPAATPDTSWEVAKDFRTAPAGGAFSYGWMPALEGSFVPYDTITWDGWRRSPAWHNSSSSEPVVWKNTSSARGYGIVPGEVSLHPGPRGQLSVVRWTSPVAGTISVVGTFGRGDRGANGEGSMDYFILKNGVPIFKEFQSDQTASFSWKGEVAAGDTVDFAVGGGYSFGNTPLDATISSSP